MFEFLRNLGRPWSWLIPAAAAVALLGAVVLATGWVQSKRYWGSSGDFHQKQQAWQRERAALLARAEEKEKRVAELEPKAIAFDALAQQHKAADAELAKKIEEVSRDEANKEAAASGSTDCATRVRRVCDLLRARNAQYDCGRLFAECPGQ